MGRAQKTPDYKHKVIMGGKRKTGKEIPFLQPFSIHKCALKVKH